MCTFENIAFFFFTFFDFENFNYLSVISVMCRMIFITQTLSPIGNFFFLYDSSLIFFTKSIHKMTALLQMYHRKTRIPPRTPHYLGAIEHQQSNRLPSLNAKFDPHLCDRSLFFFSATLMWVIFCSSAREKGSYTFINSPGDILFLEYVPFASKIWSI